MKHVKWPLVQTFGDPVTLDRDDDIEIPVTGGRPSAALVFGMGLPILQPQAEITPRPAFVVFRSSVPAPAPVHRSGDDCLAILVDVLGRRSFTTSMAYGPTIGKTIMLAYLPHEKAVKGNAFEIEYFGERYPVKVAGVGYEPLYDPENLKPRS